MSRPRTFQSYNKEDDKFQQSVMESLRAVIQPTLDKTTNKETIKELNQIILGTYNFEDWFEKKYPNELELLDKFVHRITEEDFNYLTDKLRIYEAFRNKASHYVSQIFSSHIYTKEILQNLLVYFSPDTLIDKIKNIDKSDTKEELGELKYRIYKL